MRITRAFLPLILVGIFGSLPVHAADIDGLIGEAMAGDHRDPANAARDRYRNPLETLKFFEIEPDMKVVEIWPGGGWYLEILAPAMRAEGSYVAAGFGVSVEGMRDYFKKSATKLQAKLEARPDLYDHVVITELKIPERVEIAPAGTADAVLTFRNVHNWLKSEVEDATFAAFFQALKPGGVLGVVEHRAEQDISREAMIESGYMTETAVIAIAEKAGFAFEARSDINANSKDSTDHTAGVWTLPPALRVCKEMAEGSERDACMTKYRAIGESNRMTLKFRKPAA